MQLAYFVGCFYRAAAHKYISETAFENLTRNALQHRSRQQSQKVHFRRRKFYAREVQFYVHARVIVRFGKRGGIQRVEVARAVN